MQTKELSELARVNHVVMKAHFINVLIMLTFIFLQVTSGMVTLGYALIVSVIGLAPVAAERFFFKKNKETEAIKHLAAIGYAVFYTVVLFTSAHSMVFTFVIPMILLVSLYNDTRYMIMINIGTVLESILVNVIGGTTGKCAFAGPDAAIIQVIIMIMIGFYSYSVAKTSNENSNQKIQKLKEAQDKTETVLSDISHLSEQLKSGIGSIHQDLAHLEQTSAMTENAMQEVSDGASNTAAAVQEQLRQTEAIQNKVETVSSTASDITDMMQQTLSALELGKQNVASLVATVDISVSNSESAAEKLQTLNTYMNEMHSIVELISGITSQTSLLALNASIEAARAGEAGRGFSVVATEISGMATQTKNATANITALIDNVTTSIGEVVEVIQHMISGIKDEKEEASNTSDSFSSIQENTYSIRNNVEQLIRDINDLKTANDAIAKTVQTISAVSEEVSAHATETLHSENENTEILTRISGKMQELVNID